MFFTKVKSSAKSVENKLALSGVYCHIYNILVSKNTNLYFKREKFRRG